MSQPIRSMGELLDAMRARREEINISCETVDEIANLTRGHTSRLLALEPSKNLGFTSLGSVLFALGMALVPQEDPETMAVVSPHWVKRGPSGPRPFKAASMLAGIGQELNGKTAFKVRYVDAEHLKRIAKLGAIGRNRSMGKRARQRAARHAANVRWGKVVAAAPEV